MGWISDLLRKNKELATTFDLDFIEEPAKRAYLKRMALNTCIEYMGRSLAQCEFQRRDGPKQIKDMMHYKLNVRPNSDQAAATFWKRVVYKLIYENECLVVLSDTDDLLIADRYNRNEFALYDDTFTNVVVKDYEFKRSFKMSDVFFFEYANEKLSAYVNELFSDYGEIFGRMMNAQMRNYQLRGIVNIKMGKNFNENQDALQAYIDKLYKAFSNSSVAIVPQLEGLEYEELGATKSTSNQSVNELTNLKLAALDDVARIIGIPPALVKGDQAELKDNLLAFKDNGFGALVKMMQDELNAKLYEPHEILAGKYTRIIRKISPLDVPDAIDKAVSSGVFTRNDVRDELGHERSPDPRLDEYMITKNYQTISEGGEMDENN
ncbi:phage portal protein [Listeria ilorinensis]|uniref:phage portal protein n=1 Tax=Listeria ilorinensis TaxID=2867439 RepID=UPI001EF60C47|nr:phage portal protein [Listeria ilorinensis]